MIPTNKVYAVLTGDLVKSSQLPSEKSFGAMERLKNAAGKFSLLHPATIVGQIDTFRHDSWQLLMEKPELAFRASLFLRTVLKLGSSADTKYDTRICIGIGQVELISEQKVSNSRGPAFTRSGKGLDEMDNERLRLVANAETDLLLNGLSFTTIPLLDCIISDWTPTESRAVHGILNGWTQEETARNWSLYENAGKQPTRQAIGDSLMRAHWRIVNASLLWIETTMGKIYLHS
jgi:hypothetical protein